MTKKIAIILHSLAVSGGTERQAIELARVLTRRGYAPTLYTLSYDREKCYPALLCDLRVVTASSVPALARAIDPDTALLNPHEQGPLAVAAYFRQRVRMIPSVVMVNDLYLAQWSLAREQTGRKFSLPRRFLQWCKDRRARRFFACGADEIAVLNTRTRDMVEFYVGRKAVVVRSGLDVSQFPFYARALPRGRRFRLLCHALFYRHRRFEDAIAALARLARSGIDAELTISGSYTHKRDARAYYDELQHTARECRVSDRVHCVGEVSEEELRRLYRESDVFLFPSHHQTWGLAVFEALASGLPTIVSQSVGASEVLSDYHDALLSNPCSAFSIFVLLKQLLTTPALYERLSRNGRAFVERDISWEKYTDRMEALFEGAREKCYA